MEWHTRLIIQTLSHRPIKRERLLKVTGHSIIKYMSYNSLKRILTIFSFSSYFLGLNSRILEKKGFFAYWSGGFTLPTPLVVRPLKFFYVFLPLLYPNPISQTVKRVSNSIFK